MEKEDLSFIVYLQALLTSYVCLMRWPGSVHSVLKPQHHIHFRVTAMLINNAQTVVALCWSLTPDGQEGAPIYKLHIATEQSVSLLQVY